MIVAYRTCFISLVILVIAYSVGNTGPMRASAEPTASATPSAIQTPIAANSNLVIVHSNYTNDGTIVNGLKLTLAGLFGGGVSELPANAANPCAVTAMPAGNLYSLTYSENGPQIYSKWFFTTAWVELTLSLSQCSAVNTVSAKWGGKYVFGDAPKTPQWPGVELIGLVAIGNSIATGFGTNEQSTVNLISIGVNGVGQLVSFLFKPTDDAQTTAAMSSLATMTAKRMGCELFSEDLSHRVLFITVNDCPGIEAQQERGASTGPVPTSIVTPPPPAPAPPAPPHQPQLRLP